MTDNEIIKALTEWLETETDRYQVQLYVGGKCDEGTELFLEMMTSILSLIKCQKAEIERLQNGIEELNCKLDMANDSKAEAIKEFAEKTNELLKRYSHLHKRADEARHSVEEYADGTPMEMVSVWEVLSLKKWEMVDYENMNALQDNIETLAIERLLTEIEKDFKLLKKEMAGDGV